MTPLDLFEVPRDEELPGRRDNTRLIDIVTVVELGGSEVDELDLVFHDILGVNRQLHCLGLILRDRLSETRDAVVILCGDHQDVSLASRQNPLLVLTHID